MPNNVKVSIDFSLDVDHGSGLGHHPAGPGSCQEPLLQLSCRHHEWEGMQIFIASLNMILFTFSYI